MLVNQQAFDLRSSISDDWGGSHRLVIDVKALTKTNNWELGFSLPENYKVKEIYGADLNHKNGKSYLSGKSWNQNLNQGQESQIVLIVEEGESGKSAPIKPNFFFAESVINSGADNSNQRSNLKFNSSITDDWGSSHRAVLDLEALFTAKNWQAELSLPNNYKVKEIYGGQLSYRNGKTYLSGKSWNKNLNQGQKSQVVLIVDEGKSGNQKLIKPTLLFGNQSTNSNNNMLSNSKNNFNLNSTITDDWGGSHRVVLDLEALSQNNNWQAGFNLAEGYKIKEIYGGKLNYEDGQAYVSGESWNKNLNQGQKAQVVLIVEEGKNADSAPIKPQLISDNSPINSAPQAQIPTDKPSQSGSNLSFNSDIVEDWQGGYKLELDIKAQADANDWKADFQLPHKITAAYGVDLIDRGNGNYTISGQNNQASLAQGQSIRPIFIIDDGGESALKLDFEAGGNPVVSSTPEPQPQPTVTQPTAPEQKQNAPQDTVQDIVVEADGNGNIIKVDDFGGNLGQAIAAAQNGDVVQFSGNKTYYTYGVTIDKDITLDGQPGTVINGGGTESPIIRLGYNADGATIQDLEITNGNVGITANGAKNLLLQNLNVNNIGISKTIRYSQNNIGINIDNGEGLQLRNSEIHNICRKGVSVGDTDGAVIDNLNIHNVNLDAQHAQSHDAAGIKFFNTNDILLKNSTFSKINAFNIWNDTTSNVTIDGNTVINVGDSFKRPSFNNNVDIGGIYNEKSYKSVITNNKTTSYGDFDGFKATKYTTETMEMYGNDFSKFQLGTTDYWVNEGVEKLIAETENPSQADFSLFADQYNAQANIG